MSARTWCIAIGLMLALPAFAEPEPAAAPAKPAVVDQCFACHRDGGGAETRDWSADVHFAEGISCAGCHGGDPTAEDQDAAMSKSHGYRGKFRKSDIPAVCGQCHGAKQTALGSRYKLTAVSDSLMAGVHGQALLQSEAGPQCVSCHGVHGILRASDPRSPVHPLQVAKTCAKCHSSAAYMRDFDPRVAVDQYEKYLTSVHGKGNKSGDARTATCVSCHSNHLIHKVKDPRSPVYATRIPETCSNCHSDAKYMARYKIPTDQYAKYKKSRHGIALLEHSDLNAPACNSCHGNHGAVPPGPASTVAICGNCHQSNAELYEKSAHKDAFAKKGLSACVVCHGNHLVESPTDKMVGFAPEGPCAKCHRNDATDKSAASILELRAVLDSLNAAQDEATQLLERAEQLGMDVSDARYELKGAHQALVQSRVAIHTFRLADLAVVARPGIDVVTGARKAANDAIQDYYFRRKGLAISTLIVTLVAILLFLKIKEIDKADSKK